MSVNNISVLPMESPPSPAASKKSSPSVVVVTPKASDVIIIKEFLGNSCELTTCSTLSDFSDLMRRSRDAVPDIVLVRDRLFEQDADVLEGIAKSVRRHTPVLVMGDAANRTFSTLTAKSGVRDIVFLDEPDHLRFVVKRELRDYRVRCAYKHYASRAAKYRR